MATNRTPSTDAEPTHVPVVGNVDEDEIDVRFEAPHVSVGPDERQANAVATHRESGRTVRHMVLLDAAEGEVSETIIGLVNGEEVWRVDREDTLSYAYGTFVYVEALGETMTLSDYIEMVGADETGWKLGSGFREYMREAAGL